MNVRERIDAMVATCKRQKNGNGSVTLRIRVPRPEGGYVRAVEALDESNRTVASLMLGHREDTGWVLDEIIKGVEREVGFSEDQLVGAAS